MNSPAELEAPPRLSVDTIIGERPPSPKVQSSPMQQQTQYEAVVSGTGNNTLNRLASPAPELFRPLRSENIPRDQRIEWENIRAQLGLSDVEEGRVDLEHFRGQPGLIDDDESPTTLLKQIGQAGLVFLTSPFMLLHGVFKMMGVFLKSLGIIFAGLALLCKKLTYKPKKNKAGRGRQGLIQI